MKKLLFLSILSIAVINLQAQQSPDDDQRKSLTKLIDQYSEARAKSDTVLLKSILTTDIDQLVSTGEWRNGIRPAVKGMLSSSSSNSGKRTLTVEKIKMLNASCAVVDCRYEIQEANGSMRKMWSTFIAVSEKGKWRISAIRNMLPSTQ
jgi:flagellar biosynthesis regulator FlaF